MYRSLGTLHALDVAICAQYKVRQRMVVFKLENFNKPSIDFMRHISILFQSSWTTYNLFSSWINSIVTVVIFASFKFSNHNLTRNFNCLWKSAIFHLYFYKPDESLSNYIMCMSMKENGWLKNERIGSTFAK